MNMMSFDSIKAYQRAKGATIDGDGPTNEIKNILYPASVTSATPISASVVSYIKGYGTVVDSTNIIVNEKYGDLGDVLMDKGGTKYWLKSRLVLSGNEMLSLGGVYYNSETMDSSFTQIGVLVDRYKNDGLIMSLTDTTKAYSSDTLTTIPNVTTYSSIRRNKAGGVYDTWIASGSLDRAEAYFGSTYNQYVWPFPRTAWNAMMEKVMANTSGSGSSGTSWSWTVTASTDGTGIGVGSFTCSQTEGNRTFNPKDYGYSFDKWYRAEVEVQYPTTGGAVKDMAGLNNTKALVAWGTSKGGAATYTPAADWCNNYSVAVSGYGAGNWWLPACGELLKALRLTKLLKKKGVHPAEAYHWTSTQYSAQGAWFVNFFNSFVNFNTKSYTHSVRAFSAYHFL